MGSPSAWLSAEGRFACEVSRLIETGISATIHQKRVTYDLHRLMEGAVNVKTSEFAAAIVGNMVLPAAA